MRGMEVPKEKKNWEKDVGIISEIHWNRILELAPLVSVSPSQKMSHLFLLLYIEPTIPQANFFSSAVGWIQVVLGVGI